MISIRPSVLRMQVPTQNFRFSPRPTASWQQIAQKCHGRRPAIPLSQRQEGKVKAMQVLDIRIGRNNPRPSQGCQVKDARDARGVRREGGMVGDRRQEREQKTLLRGVFKPKFHWAIFHYESQGCQECHSPLWHPCFCFGILDGTWFPQLKTSMSSVAICVCT
jgi:hypothetical protein